MEQATEGTHVTVEKTNLAEQLLDHEADRNQEDTCFVERLRKLIKECGSAHALARKASISQSGLHRYLTGSEPSRPVLIAIANAMNVSVEWLATGKQRVIEFDTHQNMTLIQVPIYAANSISYGEKAYDQELLTSFAFCREWMNSIGLNVNKIAALVMQGDSMSPTIRHGDSLLIERVDNSFVDGEIFAIQTKNEFMIRRLQHYFGGRIHLSCDNPDYPALTVSDDKLSIVGKVVWRGTTFTWRS